MQTTNGTGNNEMNLNKSRVIKAIIFDMDNTLFDFVKAKLLACEAVVSYVNLNDDMKLLDYFIKDEIDVERFESIARYLKDRNIYTEETFETCCKIYLEVKLGNIEPYPGVVETLKEIKKLNLKCALVTDAFTENARARLVKTGLLQFFDLLVTADLVGTKKPEPDSLKYALTELGCTVDEVISVGDSLRRDITPSNELGLVTVYAAYGDRNFYEESKGSPDYTINNIQELIPIIKSYLGQEISRT